MPTSPITSLPNGIGYLPQLAFQRGIWRQISEDMKDFELVKAMRVGNPQGRALRFMLQTGNGAGAVQAGSISDAAAAFPAAQRSSVQEFETAFKQYNTTIEISEALASRLRLSGASLRYAEELAYELQDKLNVSRRRFGVDLHLDGSGVQATASVAADTTGADGSVLVTLSTAVSAKGFVNAIQWDDLLLVKTSAGAAVTPTLGSGTFYAYKVIEVLRDSDQIRIAPVNSSYARLNLTSSGISSGHLFYRVGQNTIPDFTGTIADYATASESFVGLESLVSADGRVVNGMTMSGLLASIVKDKSGEVADIRHLLQLVDALRNRNGGGYRYSKVLCSSEYVQAIQEARRQDVRFSALEGKHGYPGNLMAQVGDVALEFATSEFCRKDRQWVIPQAGPGGKAPVQVVMSDFQAAQDPDGGAKWVRKVDSNGSYLQAWNQFMSSFIGSYNCAPSSCGVIRGATVGV
jgi:hypothetical protein